MTFDTPMPVPNTEGLPATRVLDCTMQGIEVRDAGMFYAVRWKVDVDALYWSAGTRWTPYTLINKTHVVCVQPPVMRDE